MDPMLGRKLAGAEAGKQKISTTEGLKSLQKAAERQNGLESYRTQQQDWPYLGGPGIGTSIPQIATYTTLSSLK